MKNILLTILAFLFSKSTNAQPQDKALRRSGNIFGKMLKKKNIHIGFLSVYSATKSIDWNFVEGSFADGTAANADHPFLTASIGKTFTATIICLLQEQGRLGFNDPISLFLPEDIMEKLHVYNGKDRSKQITIAHLLRHQSGLPDYFEDATRDGSPNVMQQILEAPERVWEPLETIDFAKEKMQALFPPGTAYHYTDTEYVLLGLIIEKICGIALHQVFEELIFTPLHMRNTAMHLRSKPLDSTGTIAECFAGSTEISKMPSLSADWAGGGLISTSADLNRFQAALWSGKLLSHNTLETMQQWIPETRGMYYGFGLRKIVLRQLFPTLPKLTLIGHSGSTGSFMYYCPELDVFFSGSLNQTKANKQAVIMMIKILSAIQKCRRNFEATPV